MIYEFELGYNSVEVTKSLYYVKGEGAVDNSTVRRWFIEFRSGCKCHNSQAVLGRSKSGDSESVLQAIDANLVRST